MDYNLVSTMYYCIPIPHKPLIYPYNAYKAFYKAYSRNKSTQTTATCLSLHPITTRTTNPQHIHIFTTERKSASHSHGTSIFHRYYASVNTKRPQNLNFRVASGVQGFTRRICSKLAFSATKRNPDLFPPAPRPSIVCKYRQRSWFQPKPPDIS